MKIYKLYRYYQFGYNYRILLSIDEHISNKNLAKKLKEYTDFIGELNLVVTKSGVGLHGLERLYSKIQKISEDETQKDEMVEEKLRNKIIEKLKKIDPILDAELNIKVGFILDDKRYSNDILTKNIDRMFANTVFEALPEMAKEDFREAGFCLAFDRYTAAAFHSLRGTEEVLKYYYKKLLGKEPSAKGTWGTFLTAINKRIRSKGIKPEPHPELMVNLENLRKYHRNVTQHPVRTYSSDEAQDLMSSCCKAINEIFKDLELRNLLQ